MQKLVMLCVLQKQGSEASKLLLLGVNVSQPFFDKEMSFSQKISINEIRIGEIDFNLLFLSKIERFKVGENSYKTITNDGVEFTVGLRDGFPPRIYGDGLLKWLTGRGVAPGDGLELFFSDPNALVIFLGFGDDRENFKNSVDEMVHVKSVDKFPLNQIMFGPPGTGKTYDVVYASLQILDPYSVESYEAALKVAGAHKDKSKAREVLRERFDFFCDKKQIRFVTFHQSFSYEDFVEGLRAETDEKSGQLHYRVANGIFKTMCIDAKVESRAAFDFINNMDLNENHKSSDPNSEEKPYVLIIDEINRGNISRIFGELITLIEPSKRAGADEELSVTLPYSKERFSVPSNVYLIGTMNTADRSLAGLDLALRRRFTFIEKPPKPELLDGLKVTGVDIGRMLRVMNQRITVLLNADHCLGQAYFMPLLRDPTLSQLSAIFRQSILPLLQEYFFEDWERIRWVLNDQSKPDHAAFIVADKSLDLSALFPQVHDKLRQRSQWCLNSKAFDQPAAYAWIIGIPSVAQQTTALVEATPEAAEA
ncbi:McrB family protein [Craterilacuibacter sinensis]|uniref:AAA domain-containing protein n=1 Tax=Craterilacuibacter sinensis TaxID=2686017 RepID=A0A845BIU6_9NEIS|nr:AAA family ATPase [Craterilacuibacter sinensis]MXR36119.1 AAA domain-containing protein [Craterilacuibacter sinensis]